MPLVARSSRLILLVLLTVLTACTVSRRAHARPPDADAPVRYHVEIPEPHRQYVHVRMQVPRLAGRSADVAMPAWAPGSYLIRDFARHVYDLRAQDEAGRTLPVTHLDKQTWRVEHGGQPFELRYRVFAAEPGVRTSHVDDGHASLLGSSVFLYVVDQLARPAEVTIALPPRWSAHCALPSAPDAPAGTARLQAPDYDALVDAPIELGTPQVRTFTIDRTRFEYVLTGAQGTAIDVDRLAADAERVARAQRDLMDGLPMERYVLLMWVSPHGGGGLEHAASTSMMMQRSAFDHDGGYARAARLVAHEMFHLWNVKRIHDRVLGPFDYDRENHSRLLWFHEGFTETMEGLSLLRAGLVTPREHVGGLGGRWTSYLDKPGRNHDPIAEISFDAWTKAYKPAPNHPNVAVSYYEKGDLIGVVLDLELRLRAVSHGRTGSLPGVFRRLMASHGAKGRGIELRDVVAACTAEAGEDMAWFFERYVEGTEELPLAELMPKVGVEVKVGAPWLDEAGRPRAQLDRRQRRERIYTGLTLARADAGAVIRNVVPGSPADAAGLMRDDEIVAVDTLRTDGPGDALARFADHDPGQTVTLTLFRAGRLQQRTMTLAESTKRTYRFSLADDGALDATQRKVREAWLGPPA